MVPGFSAGILGGCGAVEDIAQAYFGGGGGKIPNSCGLLVNFLHGSGSTILVPGFDYDSSVNWGGGEGGEFPELEALERAWLL